MHKVVYNDCYGGFSLSGKAASRLAELMGTNYEDVGFGSICPDIPRHNPYLVQVVEELGKGASGLFADLKIVEIDQPLYNIVEYDGCEFVETPSDTNWINAAEE